MNKKIVCIVVVLLSIAGAYISLNVGISLVAKFALSVAFVTTGVTSLGYMSKISRKDKEDEENKD